VSLSLSLEPDCVRDRTHGLFHRLPGITPCYTDGVQLMLQNLGGHGRHARSRWTSGTAAAADAAWWAEQRRRRRRRRRRQLLQQVASSVCSLSVSSTSVTQPCSTCMPSTTSDSGTKATSYIGRNVRVCKKARGNIQEGRPGECPGEGKCPSPIKNFIQNVHYCDANACCIDHAAADNGCCTTTFP